MLRLLVILVLLVLLAFQLDWLEITPKAHRDFKKIRSFFNGLVADKDVDKYKKKVNAEITEKKEQIEEVGELRHQINDVGVIGFFKAIYQDFFGKSDSKLDKS